MEVKEFRECMKFACTVQFWRMAVLWTLSLVISYLQLLIQSVFMPKSKSYTRYNFSRRTGTTKTAAHSTAATRMPICIITGMTPVHDDPSTLGVNSVTSQVNELFRSLKYGSLCHNGVTSLATASLPKVSHTFIIQGHGNIYEKKESCNGYIWLGSAAALALSKEGFSVVLVGWSSRLLSKTMSDIRRQNKDAQLKGFQVNVASFQSVMQFKCSLQQWLLDSDMHSSIQLLINNAGILATSCRLTTEGYDEMMGTNYIGAFSLTKVLLPLLRNSPSPSRIVNVTSFTHRNVYSVQVDKETVSGKCFSSLKYYPCAHVYEYSKLCLLLFSYELHRQLDGMEKSQQVSIIAADPGVVKTRIMREVPFCLSQFAFIVLKLLGLLQSPESGVRSIIDAALSPPEISGVYFFGGNGRTLDSSALSYDTKLSNELWATSCDLLQESLLTLNNSST